VGGGRSTGWRVAGEVEGGRSAGKKGMTGWRTAGRVEGGQPLVVSSRGER
jgi:hypothetical protein